MSSIVKAVTKRLQHPTIQTPLNKDKIKLPDKRVIIAKNKQNTDVYITRHVLRKVKQAVNSTRENIQKDVISKALLHLN